MPELVSIGTRIAEQRKKLKLSQTALARKAGISRATLDALENGRAGEMGFAKLSKLLTALGLELKLQAASSRPAHPGRTPAKRIAMIKVWTDAAEAGLLDRHGERGGTFAYLPGAPAARAVSVTMPVRLESWTVPFGLPPIFEMNLPEGALRERLRLAFAKATGTFDEFDLLSVVGRSQVGRIRYTGDKEQLHEDVPFQSVDEILERRRGGDLFRYLLEKFASFSGISGVQPKILLRDEKAFAEMEHTGRPALAELQRRDPHREIVGAERVSATGGERIFLPHSRAQMRTRRAPLPAGRRRHGAGDRPLRSAHGRHVSRI